MTPSTKYTTVLSAAVDWLKKNYPALCVKSGLCESIGGRLYTRTAPLDAIEYPRDTWYRCQTIDQMQAFYLARLPAMRDAAKECGYALGLHGSTRRDLDIIAMPWREGAADKDALAHAMQVAACGMYRQGPYQWERKPAGRVATSFPICATEWHDMISAGHVDLSIIAAAPQPPEEAK